MARSLSCRWFPESLCDLQISLWTCSVLREEQCDNRKKQSGLETCRFFTKSKEVHGHCVNTNMWFFARLHENANTFQITTQFQWQASICTSTSATDILNSWCAKQWQPPKASKESQQAYLHHFHGHHWIQKTPFIYQIGKWDEERRMTLKKLCVLQATDLLWGQPELLFGTRSEFLQDCDCASILYLQRSTLKLHIFQYNLNY